MGPIDVAMADDVPFSVRYYVNDVVGDTRHVLRGEIAEAIGRVERAQREAVNQASIEHAQVRGDLAGLSRQVSALEQRDAVDAAVVSAREELLDKIESASGDLWARRLAAFAAVAAAASAIAAFLN